jgi:hypothetical protein
MNRETEFDLEISTDVLAEIHFGGENCCTPQAPCTLAKFHQERIFQIQNGARAQGTTVVDHLVDLNSDAHARPAAGTLAANQFGTFQVKQASLAQVQFLTNLLNNRDLTKITYRFHATTVRMAREAVEQGTMSLKLASSALDILTALPVLPGTSTTPDAPSEKQVSLITREMARRQVTSIDLTLIDIATLTRKQASGLIDVLLAAPFKPREVSTEVPLEIGMYRKADGTMYRAYAGREHSDRILAKRLIPTGADTWGFEYAGLASRFVVAAERMTLAEAKAWGAQFGTCCVCSALLTDPSSVQAGIGPICSSRI